MAHCVADGWRPNEYAAAIPGAATAMIRCLVAINYVETS